MEIEAAGTTLHIDAHQIVKQEGFAAHRIFIVCKGRIKLTASSPEGKLLILRIAGPGDIIGSASMLRGDLYRITAETLEPCELKVLGRENFMRLMRNSPDISRNTSEAIGQEYDAALLSARRLALSTSAAAKLASVLLDLAHHPAPAITKTAIEFSMPLTHEELGCMAGLSRETVTRLLGRFRAEGLIDLHGDHMSLLHPDQLTNRYC
jgi:CRP/FNR family transcriptional regulator